MWIEKPIQWVVGIWKNIFLYTIISSEVKIYNDLVFRYKKYVYYSD